MILNFPRTEKRCNNNTAVKYIMNFGKIIRIFESWLVGKDPFMNYDSKFDEVTRVLLNESRSWKGFSSKISK